MKILAKLFLTIFACYTAPTYGAGECAGGMSTSGVPAQNTVLIVWAKTVDDASTFPSWANAIPSTLTGFYTVMSYNQHAVTTKVATKNGEFYVSDQGHTVNYYKNLYQQSPQGYIGPWGIFVEEILDKVEADYGAAYFDDVSLIAMMVTDGGPGWYIPSGNYSGIAWLGVDYTTGSGKFFDRYSGGVTNEFIEGESTTKHIICHEYGHYLGLFHPVEMYGTFQLSLGTYSLMYPYKLNEAGETTTPLSTQDIMKLAWLNINDATRVKIITSNTSVTLKQIRSTTGIVAAKVNIPGTSEYFLISNHQQSTNVYDGTYPASGLLIWHINGSNEDLEGAVALDPATYGFNFDHLSLPRSNPNHHGEGLATDFHNPTNKTQLTPWTNPNSDRFVNGPYTGIAITNIALTGTDMSFNVNFNFNSGTITENSWWNGSESIGGNVTLNPGRTLTVTPGTTASFSSGAILIVNGNLQAVGTGTGASQKITLTRSGAFGTWGGVLFGSSGSGNITYATITHATKGVRADFANGITVNNCTIQNFTQQGVNFNAAAGTVQNSTINNPSGASHGVYVYSNSGNITIANNTISSAPIGVGVSSGSSGIITIRDNDISNSSANAGILISSSTVQIYRNYVHNCQYGIRLQTGSSADIHDNDLYAVLSFEVDVLATDTEALNMLEALISAPNKSSPQADLAYNAYPVTARIRRQKTGIELVEVDIAQVINHWVTRGVANNGLLLVSRRNTAENALRQGQVALTANATPAVTIFYALKE